MSEPSSLQTMACPKCNLEVHLRTAYCPHCNAVLDNKAKEAQQPPKFPVLDENSGRAQQLDPQNSEEGV